MSSTDYKASRYAVSSYLSLVNQPLFGPNIFLSRLFPNTLSVRDQYTIDKYNYTHPSLLHYVWEYVVHNERIINPLNAELNPICHLLILLGDLTFKSTCIVSIFQYISNKMQRYTVYLCLETTLHVSGGTFTHHQERIQLYLQHLVFVTPLLLSSAIVEELEPVWVCCGWRKPPTAHSNRLVPTFPR
jgi:hypothetical protein